MKIRFAQPTDKERVLSLLNQLGHIINTKVSFDPKNIQAHIYGSKNYDRVVKRKNIKIFIVEDHGEIIGVASFFILTDFICGEKFAHIDDFIIDEKYRGNGYGTYLMKGILQYAQQHKIHTVKLTSSLQLTDAHRFYEKLGGVFSQKVIKFSV